MRFVFAAARVLLGSLVPYLQPRSLCRLVLAQVQGFRTGLGCTIKDGSRFAIFIAKSDDALPKFARQDLKGEHHSVDVFPMESKWAARASIRTTTT